MNHRYSSDIRFFLGLAGSRYWAASLLPALVGTTLPFWFCPPGFSFRLTAAVEFLLATLLAYAGFSFLLAAYGSRPFAPWNKQRLLTVTGVCISAACLLGLHLNAGLTLHTGVPPAIFIIFGLVTLFIGALYVLPPLRFYRRMGGEIVVAEGLGMLPVLGAYLVQVGDITRKVYLACLPLVVATGLWIWMEEIAAVQHDETRGRRTLVMDLGLKFSARLGIPTIVAAFFMTLIAGVFSDSIPPWSMIALLLLWPACRIVIVSWNGYTHPERMIPLVRDAIVLHLVTGVLFILSPLFT